MSRSSEARARARRAWRAPAQNAGGDVPAEPTEAVDAPVEADAAVPVATPETTNTGEAPHAASSTGTTEAADTTEAAETTEAADVAGTDEADASVSADAVDVAETEGPDPEGGSDAGGPAAEAVDAPGDHAPVDEPLVDDAPVDDAPVDDAMVDENSPVDEPLVDDAPVGDSGGTDETAAENGHDGTIHPGDLDEQDADEELEVDAAATADTATDDETLSDVEDGPSDAATDAGATAVEVAGDEPTDRAGSNGKATEAEVEPADDVPTAGDGETPGDGPTDTTDTVDTTATTDTVDVDDGGATDTADNVDTTEADDGGATDEADELAPVAAAAAPIAVVADVPASGSTSGPADEDVVAAPQPAVARRRWGVALVLNRVGRVLIGAGLVILLFVGYQLWGTNIQEHRSQDSLENSFSDTLAQLETVDPDVLAALRGAQSSTTTAAGSPATTPTTISREVFDLIAPQEGEPVAVIRIPRIGVERRVVEGTDVDDLRRGPGHYADSPLPGQAGNAAIAGHRTTYGAPFNRIDELAPGDEIQVQTVQGTAVYQVDQAPFIVTPDQVEVLDDYDDNRLTLTSCHPKLSSAKRMIVTAKLMTPPFPELPTDAAPVAADVASTTTIPDAVEDPNATTTTAVPTVTAPGETTTVAPVTSATDDPTSTEATGGEGDDATLGTPDQLNLDQGLAGDRSALPSAIGWGAFTAALAVLAWLLARTFERRVRFPRHGRRLLVYVLVSPVLLFFLFLCFENVDRLLPAY